MSLLRYPCIPIGRSRCARTRQSCLFKPDNLSPLVLTHLEMFSAYPSGYVIDFKNEQKPCLSFRDNVYNARGFSKDPSTRLFKCKSFLIFISSKSMRALFFPSMLNKVPIKLSHIFFSMCMTSRLCRTLSVFQQGS